MSVRNQMKEAKPTLPQTAAKKIYELDDEGSGCSSIGWKDRP